MPCILYSSDTLYTFANPYNPYKHLSLSLTFAVADMGHRRLQISGPITDTRADYKFCNPPSRADYRLAGRLQIF